MDAITQIIQSLLGSPITWGVILVFILSIAGSIIKKTKGTKDDAIFAMVVKAFDLAEKIIPDNKGPAWVIKADQALKTFKEQYIERYDKNPPKSLVNLAKDQWTILSHELKKK